MTTAERLTTIAENVAKVYEAGKAAGGVVAVEEKDVNFYDYDGTLLYSYTLAEAQALTELPPAPTPPKDFLEFEEWNWTLAQIKDYNLPVQVGAVYKTVDGKTRAVIRIDEDWQKEVVIRYCQWCSSIVVDWGDGSAEAPTTTGNGANYTVQHTYAEKGEYVITVDANGTWNLGLNSATTPFFGNISANKNDAFSLKEVYLGRSARLLGNALRLATQMSAITIPTTSDRTWGSALQQCQSLKALILPSSFTLLDGQTARHAIRLVVVSLDPKLTSIGYWSFEGLVARRISIPNSTTSVSLGPTRIDRITLPEGVLVLDGQALYNSPFLAEVVLPASLTSIGAQCFYGAEILMRVRFNGTTPPTVANANAFTGIPTTCIVEVPAASLEAYKNATNYGSIAAQMVGV